LGALYIADRSRKLTLADALRAFEHDRRARETELLLAVRHELQWNLEILRDARAGDRYGPTQRTAWTASLGVPLPERQRGPLRRAYHWGSLSDEAVRTLPPDFSGAPRPLMTPKVQESARGAEGYFDRAAELLDEELKRRGLIG
jgi:hypothetical protein